MHSRYSLLPDYSKLLLFEEEDSMVSADTSYSLRRLFSGSFFCFVNGQRQENAKGEKPVRNPVRSTHSCSHPANEILLYVLVFVDLGH